MAKSPPQLDVLVVGEHPCTYLAAMLLAGMAKIRVAHCCVPGNNQPDRLVLINPDFFGLLPSLAPLRRKLEMTPVYGIQFLGDDATTRSEFRNKSAMAYVATYKAVRTALCKLAQAEKVELLTPKTFQILHVDENGVEISLGKNAIHPRALLLGGELPAAQKKILGLPEGWGPDIVHRYTYLKLPAGRWMEPGSRPIVPMSLNLRHSLCWGWLLPGFATLQLAVVQPVETLVKVPPSELLSEWAGVLKAHGVLMEKGDLPLDAAESLDLPLAGALEHDGVASRTLLIGPEGGFYSACAEDIHPNCWSAVFAGEAIKKALREPHLQDGLQPFSQKWRTTLGEYLRGPQQNLRFLLPLVYRNQKMTTRLAESILQGKKVIR
jgi:flavin-dependent dehydrogenase